MMIMMITMMIMMMKNLFKIIELMVMMTMMKIWMKIMKKNLLARIEIYSRLWTCHCPLRGTIQGRESGEATSKLEGEISLDL